MTRTEAPHQFGLLGDEHDWPLTKALQHSDAHKVVAIALAGRSETPSRNVRQHDGWESLQGDDAVDAVIVCDTRVEVLDAARKLAACGQPVIVPAWTAFPPEFVAELSLSDAEGSSKLVPCFTSRPVVEPLRQLIVAGRLGTISSIQLDRSGPEFEAGEHEPTWYSGVSFGDIDWLRLLGGDYSQVTLIRSGGDDRDTFITQTLQLSGPGLPDAICTYRRSKTSKTPETFQLCVEGSEGTAELRREGDREQSEFVLQVDGVETLRSSANDDLTELLEGLNRSWRQEPGGAQWRDFVRVHEISEAMQRSLRRRRTIDLHFETASERSQFKTQMATVGCFMLVYTCFASMCMLFAGAVLDPRDELQRKAETSAFVLTRDDFDAESEQLTSQGQGHLEEIIKRWQTDAAAVVIVESEPRSGADSTLLKADRERLVTVRQQLNDAGVLRVEERTTSRPLTGHGFRTLMSIGRVIAFAPLGLFLLLQLLLFVARPPRDAGK